MAVVDDRGPQALVGGPRPQAIALGRHDVEAAAGPGGVHALQEDEVIEVAAVVGHRRRQCAGQDDGRRVYGLDAVVGQAQQAREGLRVDVLQTPLLVAVGLIPDLIVADAAAVAPGHGGGKVGEVVEVVGRGVVAQRVALGAAPGRRVAQAGDDGHAAGLGQGDDLIVLGPGVDAGRVVAPVDEVAAGVDLDVLPGELLADGAEAGAGHQVEDAGALLWLGLLLQEGIDGERADGGIGQGRTGHGRRVEARLGANGRVEPVDEAGGLAACGLFAGQVIEGAGVRPQGEQEGHGGHDDEEAGGHVMVL